MSIKTLKIFLFVAILINFYLSLTLTPLFNLDEGAFSEATREMLINHNFITTYLNGELRFDKPILIYWLQAISVSIFGINEFAFRLPSSIAATFWALGIYLFTRKLYEEKTAIFASFFMVTALQIGLIAKAAIADSLLNMFISFSMFSLFIYIKNNQKKYLYFAFAFIGFGFLTKGPIAILIPLATYFFYSIIKKTFKEFLKDLFNPIGIIIFSLIALPWYILEYLDQGNKFIEGFFLKHNLSRFETSFEKHKGSIIYYIPVILIGLLPWTSVFIKYLTNLKNYLKQKDDFILFGSIWFIFVFIFFSLSGTKLPHYVIYGYTPLFIFMALAFKEIKSEFLLSLPIVLFLIILISIPFFLQKNIGMFDDFTKTAVITLLPLFNKTYFAVLLTLLFLSIFKFTKEIKAIILGFSMTIILNYIGWIYAHVRAVPVKEAANYVKKHNIKKVVMYRLNTPSFNVYAKMLVAKRTPKPGDIVLTKVTSLNGLNFDMLYKSGVIALIKVKPKNNKELPFNYKKDRE